jgi:hypothetical protein
MAWRGPKSPKDPLLARASHYKRNRLYWQRLRLPCAVCCRTSDEIVLLEAELRGSSLVVAGYAGQPRPNPLLKIIQDHRLLLRRLVDSLALPDEGEESGLRPGQRHAQAAARGRWRERPAEPNGRLAELRAAGWGRDGEAS